MKYTGKLLKDMGKDHPLILRMFAENWTENTKETAYLVRRLGKIYRRNARWGQKFVQASNSKYGPREFLGGFFIHWLAAFRADSGVWTHRQAMEFQHKEGIFSC
jgi:hypothetical protein